MTTVAARPPRPIPTVQANPALLRGGDIIYPDVEGSSPEPSRIISRPQRLASGWRIELDSGRVLLVAKGAKVRTQRRPNPQQPIDQDVADRLAENYQEPRYG